MKAKKGFTLLELMIALVIVAIISAIAYPAYREHVAKSRRAEARTILLAAQQWMERFYSENFRYDQNAAGVAVSHASQFPSRFSVSPLPEQGRPVYDISLAITANVRDVYKISATRRSGSLMALDRCGDYSIDHLGRRDLVNYSGFSTKSAAIQACWN